MIDWNEWFTWLFWPSVVMFIVGLVVTPVLVVLIPADYFIGPAHRPVHRGPAALRLLFHVFKNLFALLFLVAGIIMLFTPGQGLLMLLIALWLADFPGKRRLEQRIIAAPGVVSTINKIRAKAGKDPLQVPDRQH
jgi:hypothetical protein